MNTGQIITICIQAALVIVYIVIFFIQKKQIDFLKETITTMKSFMDIFNIDSIKKYVEIKEDHARTFAAMQILDNREVKSHLKKIIDERGEEVANMFHEQFTEQQYQLLYIAENTIMSLPKNQREKFIDDFLPSVKHILWPVIQQNEESENQSNKQN